MLFDRQSSLRGFFAGVLFVMAIGVAPEAPAVPSTPIEGRSFFVAPGGIGVSNDRAQPGNVNDTVRRICDGTATQITGGDAIIFLDGTYLTSALNLPLPGDARQPGRHGNAIAMLDKNCGGPLYVKLLADNAREAVLRNDVSANDTSGGFDIRASSYIWIEGFRIIGINSVAVPWEAGVKFGNGSHHVVVRNNRIEATGGGGIGAGGATHFRIENNEIYGAANTHPYCASAISLYRLENAAAFAENANGYSNVVVGNRVFGTRAKVGCDADANPANGVRSSDGNCIIMDLNNETGYRNRTLIANNVCVNNGGGGVHLFNSGYADVVNNTLYSNGAVHRLGEISVTCSVPGTTEAVRFFNNLVWATTTAPAVASNFRSQCAMKGIVHAHNLFVGMDPLGSDFIGVPYPEATTDVTMLGNLPTGNLFGVSPASIGFVMPSLDPGIADFSLASASSPAVNVGVVKYCETPASRECADGVLPEEISSDVGGKQRINGVLVDIGAHEYQAAALPPPPLQSTTIVLRARATLAAGVGAAVAIYADGQLIGTASVDSTEMADFPFSHTGPTPSRIEIVFTNDAVIATEDRNLFVESVRVGEVTLRPTDPGVVVDRGGAETAFDGLDLLAGQGSLWWNSALRLIVPPTVN